MRILFKRKAAAFIDYFLIGTVLTVCGLSNAPEWFWHFEFNIGVVPVSLPSIGFFIVLLLIIFKDFVFRNASVGKKIMKLRIVDENWNIPSFKLMLKRGFMMQTVGYATYIKYCFLGGDIVDWEMKCLRTQVVSLKQFNQQKKVNNTDSKQY